MVVAYHLIWMIYGSWLPNDPRGSSSHEIRNAKIAGLGELHHGRKKIQPASGEIGRFYEAAKLVLQHESREFSSKEIDLIAGQFSFAIRKHGYTCYAAAIMPDHVHMLIRKHRDKAERMIKCLQDESREEIIKSGWREPDHPVWGGPGWKVFLESRADIERVIRYIEQNAINARLWRSTGIS